MKVGIPVLLLLLTVALPPTLSAQRRRPAKTSVRAPENPQILFRRALAAYTKGDKDDAEKIVRTNLSSFPDHWPSLALFARLRFEKQDYKEARQALNKALKISPQSKTLNLMAAAMLSRQKKPVAALEYLRRAQENGSPNDELADVDTPDADALQKEISLAIQKMERHKPVFYNNGSESVAQGTCEHVPENKLKIAIFEFTPSSDSAAPGDIRDKLTTSFVQSGCFLVIERGQLDKVFQEQDFELTESVDQATAAQVGMLVGVDAIVVGSVAHREKSTEIDARLVQVDTGQILAAASIEYTGRSDLEKVVRSLSSAVYK